MSSEIEVVEEEIVQSRDRSTSTMAVASSSSSTTATSMVEKEPEESLRDDVYTAAAYGDMEKLQRLVERESCSVSEPDGLGYFALQWAALNNRTAAARYILEHGGDVNAVDHTGQTALHWSAVRGAIQVAELLLKEGARVNTADMYGYQTAHVAAQYGQTSFLYQIVMKWNADPDVPDNDGRSPLHCIIGQHTKALLIVYVFFCFWMLIEDDKIKKVVLLSIGLPFVGTLRPARFWFRLERKKI